MMLSVFGDESYDETKQRVFAVAGIIGNDELWASAETAWVARLGGMGFHAAKCESEYAYDPDTNKHKANLALYRDLTQILVGSGLQGFAVGMDLAGYREFFPDVLQHSEYFKCFTEVVNRLVAFCRAVGDREPMTFTFDQRQETEFNTGRLYDIMLNWSEWREQNVLLGTNITFDSRANPRIQMADLVARETMKHLDNRVGPQQRRIRGSMDALASADGRFVFEFLSREYFGDWKSKFSQLVQMTGMTPDKFRAWLMERNLQDNWSNRLAYLTWCNNNEPPS